MKNETELTDKCANSDPAIRVVFYPTDTEEPPTLNNYNMEKEA